MVNSGEDQAMNECGVMQADLIKEKGSNNHNSHITVTLAENDGYVLNVTSYGNKSGKYYKQHKVWIATSRYNVGDALEEIRRYVEKFKS